jgi:histidine phosphotransferase ChpT
MSKNLEFSELLITKMCHDLAAPIGAIYNGVEFIDSEGDYDIRDNKAYEIIVANSEIASNKIKFFRYIYGKSDSNGETDIQIIELLARNFFANSKIEITFNNEKNAENYIQLTNIASRLLLILVYITSGCMIYGGKVDISLKRTESSKSIIIEGSSQKGIKQDPDLDLIINANQLRDMKVSNILAYLAFIISSELKAELHVMQKDNSIKFQLEI